MEESPLEDMNLQLCKTCTKYQGNVKRVTFAYVLPLIIAGLSIGCLVLLVWIKMNPRSLTFSVSLNGDDTQRYDHAHADIDMLSKELMEITAIMKIMISKMNQQDNMRNKGISVTTMDMLPKINEPEDMRNETKIEYEAVHNSPSLMEIIEGNEDLSSFLQHLQRSSLDKGLQDAGPYTVFAPTNEAFENLPSYYSKMNPDSVMKMHFVYQVKLMKDDLIDPNFNEKVLRTKLSNRFVRVNQYANSDVNGGFTVTASGRRITAFDQVASNGVLHIISGVIACVYSRQSGNIFTQLEMYGYDHKYNKFLAFLNQAPDILKLLKTAGPFTVFAPDDDAFGNLDPRIVKQMEINSTFLHKMIYVHVTNHTWYTAGITDGLSLATLEGSRINFQGNGADAKANGATMTVVDRCANNGVFHTVSTVLLPSSVQRSSIIDNHGKTTEQIQTINSA